ncbi:hypothetical protein AQJ11_02920 [Streptomyces corchorusii]|uniref:Uncharacterized protein n=2 Tax=Streptomyces TaxID=1883 RepID=A0A101QME2_STRCK|nr:hypothetical protein [Streptomyces corchorusii]KUN32494.1 hypothetical protein AQJ11_02920 [Streptomyces corchorusii]
MPKPYFGKQPLPEYKPSPETLETIKAWEDAVQREEETRHAAQKALMDELKADTDLPFAAVAAHPRVPWTEATLRIVGKKYAVPPRQPNKAWANRGSRAKDEPSS